MAIVRKKSKKIKNEFWPKFVSFVIVLTVVFTFIVYFNSESDLEKESKMILNSLEVKNSPIGFIENGQINEERLKMIATPEGYEKIKEVSGAKSDFCIYFEDEKGNILNAEGEIAGVNDEICIGMAQPDSKMIFPSCNT